MGQPTLPRCACCGYRTGCTTCPICYWTDDGRDDPSVSVVTGSRNGELSLADARLNYSIYGASAPRYQELVRPPRDDERP
ncbi:CPCC family cysteine-rich protein [Dactylosporangium sp. AC04546]|uniref:CPCC family cysteine-rich protein n=1 Tax=Dactylosporangium sp. AC04546 TaxID=2862460 RepID=UPI001EE075D8|nr:CPCC family cysteine-rich protein [Dactylosporangium sp. AC04546]WVK87148.1 CPCC family cysteine-rich protein [Dactylosporangium sp. AC04546]